MSDFIWGVAAIGEAIGRTRAQTYHLLYAGKLKSPKKIGDQWMVSRAALMQELGVPACELTASHKTMSHVCRVELPLMPDNG